MRFSAGHGALAGLLGGVAMLGVVALPAAAGRALPLDVVRFWRGVAGRPGLALVAHGALSALVGVALAAGAASVLDDDPSLASTVSLGVGFAAAHALVALALLPPLLRRFPAALVEPVVVGRLGAGLGALAVATAVAAHLGYGVAGALAYRSLVA